MYSQGVCRIRKPACAGNGCAIFPIFQTADWGQKIRRSAADDLFRVSGPFSWDILQLSFRLSQQGGGAPGMAQGNGDGIRRIVRLGQG